MRNRWKTLTGSGIGAGLMYYFGPKGDRHRRELSDQLAYAGQKFQSGISKTGHVIRKQIGSSPNKRIWSLPSSARTYFGYRTRDEEILAKKIRAGLGKWATRQDVVKAMLLKKRATRSRWTAWLGTAGILSTGLALYYLDPKRGQRRWSRTRDWFTQTSRNFQSGFSKAGRDIGNRTRGAYASIRSRFGSQSGNTDEVLAQRVRSQLGRFVSHPGSIHVTAHDGRVTLSGPILAAEVGQLIWHVYTVRGVKEIENQLDVHDEPGRIPGLQGEGTLRSAAGKFRQSNWSPAVRAIVGTVGVAASIAGIVGATRRRTYIRYVSSVRAGGRWASAASAVAGSLLAARAISNLEFSRLTGIGARRRAIDVQKTIHINAPVRQVFALWSDFENFPRFMTHVRQIRRLEDERQGRHWRWTVDGPAKTKVEFDVAITAFKNDRLIAWSTDHSSMIKHLGRVEFIDQGDGSTTVKVRMSYNPIAGALGHAVAKFFGADPKHQMDDDLMRMKSFIETGKLPHDAAAQTGTQQSSAARSRSH